jgi:hypothetical protein
VNGARRVELNVNEPGKTIQLSERVTLREDGGHVQPIVERSFGFDRGNSMFWNWKPKRAPSFEALDPALPFSGLQDRGRQTIRQEISLTSSILFGAGMKIGRSAIRAV